MFDLSITNALIVDGTGAPARTGSIGITGQRIVSISNDVGGSPAHQTIDANGQAVCPGFIDIHTHYDAQAFWDTTLSPSPLHGVTTVFGGNCGFTIAPLTPEDGPYLMRMLARVEGMPLEALEAGVPWDWSSTAEFLDRLDGTLMPNAGFLVGHSALRRVVMHDEATQRTATTDEIEAMCTLLRAGLAAGGMGFSSTWSASHNDHHGEPVPSRWASREELISLAKVAGEFPGTTLEFIPAVAEFSDEVMDVMADMSSVANRPLNWNVLQVYGTNGEMVEHRLSASNHAEKRGGRVLALTLPDSLRARINFVSGFVLDIIPGWSKAMALPAVEKLAILSDPVKRAELNDTAQAGGGIGRAIANWGQYRLTETFSAQTKQFEGRVVGEIAAELGKTAWDTLCDIVVADDLRTSFMAPDRGQDAESWRRRVEVWRDGRAIVGASDAGAHLDMIDSYSYSTTLLAKAVREHELLGLEEGVALMTSAPAALYGVTDRGTLCEGSYADIVIFDPATVGPGAVSTRADLPGGASRIYGEANGISNVIVNGVEVVRGGTFTDARPGTLLRSGRDTHTVTAR
jgi:N-acyl-D-aspartate/D-glutamate deacylase